MRILHLGKFFPPDRGGIETHVATLAAGSTRWATVEVAVAAARSTPGRTQTDEGVWVRRLRTFGTFASTPLCPGLFGVIRDARPDLVHIHHPHPLAMTAYLASGTDAPCVVTYHSDIVRQKILRRVTAPVVRETLSRAAAVLVSSPRLLDRSDTLHPFRDKCHVVPFGIDTAHHAQADAAVVAAVRRRYGKRIVLAVGRFTHYKGFEHLIRAMRDVDATLLLIGDGCLRKPLARLVAGEQLAHRVHLLGDVEDLRPYYVACDVFALPSVSPNEAFGIVQLEAMAAGKPVVNTALDSGVTYACPTGLAALTVPPGDSEALAGAITRLLDDADLARALGSAGRAHVAANFDATAMIERTLGIYEAVVTGLPAAGRWLASISA
jgi:rhamnosyl/mannosyltransferase